MFFNKFSFTVSYQNMHKIYVGTQNRSRGVYVRNEMKHIRNEGFTFTSLLPDLVISGTYGPLINFPVPNFKLYQEAVNQQKLLLGFKLLN